MAKSDEERLQELRKKQAQLRAKEMKILSLQKDLSSQGERVMRKYGLLSEIRRRKKYKLSLGGFVIVVCLILGGATGHIFYNSHEERSRRRNEEEASGAAGSGGRTRRPKGPTSAFPENYFTVESACETVFSIEPVFFDE